MTPVEAVGTSLWKISTLRYAVVCLAALAYRAATALHPYSGEGTPPHFGDFEAQRHWMEVARGLPPREWYRDGPMNNLTYWGLDYPPLSGYASILAGAILEWVDPASVELLSSHGYESVPVRVAMRATVLLADVLVLFPAVFFYASSPSMPPATRSRGMNEALACVVLSLPAMILIDHGHFQYNGVSLGLFIACVAAMDRGRHGLGASLFCMSVYFKQMSLYYAPAVAVFLLATMWRQRPAGAAALFALRVAAAVVGTTLIVFAPWLFPTSDVLHVLRRLFPVSRGLYEDKVANIWCSVSVLFKFGRLMNTQSLLLLCTACTVVFCIPFCALVAQTPTTRQLLLSSSGCALSFFLFAFQVHEKQILIPLVPISLLSVTLPFVSLWMSLASVFSMYPLLEREGLETAYVGLIVCHLVIYDGVHGLNPEKLPVHQRLFTWGSVLVAFILHALKALAPAVPSKPDLYVLLMTTYSCAHFCAIYSCLLYEGVRDISSQTAVPVAR